MKVAVCEDTDWLLSEEAQIGICRKETNLYRHIMGAYCMPEHRGRGVYKNLLNYVINTLKTEGYTRLGVDFESINPSGSGFWLKFFHAYTNSVVRRIDERIMQRASLI